MNRKTLIIAELGINHNGNIETAMRMMLAAKESGADIAKIHTYKAENVMTDATPLAEYMKNGEAKAAKPAGSFIEMARKFELSEANTEALLKYADSIGIEFLSSPFDVPSVHYLASLKLKRLKIPSGELVNPLLLEAAAKTGLPLIVSTGMANLEEVEYAVGILRKNNSGPISLLHCLTQYPAEFRHVNLNAMITLAKHFPECGIGFSDHTPGTEISSAAVALGATIIEKHLTLDKSMAGPDQSASLDPQEFKNLVRSIRNVEVAMGNGVKAPTDPELANIRIVRKSLMLVKDAKAGTVITRGMLTAKRPGTGIPAREIDLITGKRLARDVKADTPLMPSDFEPK